MSNARKIVAAALGCMALSLILVGFASTPPTVWRHLIQISPIVLALVVVFWGKPGWAFAALPIFLLWLLIMVLIWLFILGIAKVISGTFSPAEITLTVIVGFASSTGLIAAVRSTKGSGWPRAIAAFVVFGGLQFGAIWLSMLPAFNHQ